MAHFSQMKLVTVLLLVIGIVGDFSSTVEDESTRSSKVSRKLVRVKGKGRQVQRAAITAWSSFLNPERDYNATIWTMRRRNQPQYVFDTYVSLLSDVFLKEGATVNFALVGACDGTNDNTIRERFLPNEHWNALFVEPITLNYKELNKYLVKNNVADRSHTIQAAVTNDCQSPTILVKTPKVKGKENTKTPHWLRRQIGGIVDIDSKTGKPVIKNNWKIEEVKCVSGEDLLRKWASVTSKTTAGPETSKATQKRRPHILKIDAEGHDYQVLASFLTNDTKNSELPLLINYEAKTMYDKYPLACSLLESRGYVVSNYAADGFALLRSEYFLNVKAGRKKIASE